MSMWTLKIATREHEFGAKNIFVFHLRKIKLIKERRNCRLDLQWREGKRKWVSGSKRKIGLGTKTRLF